MFREIMWRTFFSILDVHRLNVFEGHFTLERKIKTVIVDVKELAINCLTLCNFFFSRNTKIID